MKYMRFSIVIASVLLLCFGLISCKQFSRVEAANKMIKELNHISNNNQLSFAVDPETFDSSDRNSFALVLRDSTSESKIDSICVWFNYDSHQISKSFSIQMEDYRSDQFVIDCLAGLCLYYESD